MKKYVAFVLVILLLSLFACSKKEVVTEQTTEVVTEEVTKEIVFSDYELAAINLINNIKGTLKNPQSLQVHSLECKYSDPSDTTYHFKIDLSAQNSMGGYTRKTYYLELGKKDSLKSSDYDSLIMAMEQKLYNQAKYTKKIDIDKILDNLDKK